MTEPVRVVLDTNVIVSAHLTAGNEATVLQLALAGRIAWHVSLPILEEYEAVLRRGKFAFPAPRITESLAAIRRAAVCLTPTRHLQVCPDPDDNKFLECAEASRAEYLVTGNLRHFPTRWKRTQVINARRFLELAVPDLAR